MAPHDKVEELARKTLGLDEEPDAPTPPFYLPLFEAHLAKCPNDSNFILELAERGAKSSVGGNGFGVVTCMEDHCWIDIILSADPTRPQGGSQDGFGSFSDYQDHCRDPRHIRGRSERCQRLGIPPNGYINSKPHPHSHHSLPSSSSPSSLPGPSRAILSRPTATQTAQRRSLLDLIDGESSSQTYYSPAHTTSDTVSRSSDMSLDRPPKPIMPSSPTHDDSLRSPVDGMSRMKQPSSPAHVSSDIKPLTAKTRSLVLDQPTEVIDLADDSESDNDNGSDVLVLTDSEIPQEYKKVTNKDNPILLTDDSDDEEDMVVRPRGIGKAVARTGSGRGSLAPIFRLGKSKSQSSVGSGTRDNGIEMVRDDSGDSITLQEKAFDDIFSDDVDSSNLKAEKGKGKQRASTSTSAGEGEDGDILTRPPSVIPPLLSADEKAKAYEKEEKERKKKAIKAEKEVKPDLPAPSAPSTSAQGPHLPVAAPAAPAQPPADDLTEYYDREQKYLNTTMIQYKTARDHYLSALVISRQRTLRVLLSSRRYPYMAPSPQLLMFLPELKDFYPPSSLASYPLNAVAGPSNQVKDGLGNPLAMPGAWNPAQPGGVPAYPGGRLPDASAYDYDAYYGEIDRPRTNEGLVQFFDENLKDFVEDTTVEESLKNLGLNALTDQLPGLRIQLMPHQVLGVDFMVGKERNKKFLGGINGDAMGLGKTVQSIALMAFNPSQDPKVKTTLIVAPLALLTQWKNEIETKCTPDLFRVLIYHGQKRIKSANHLKQYDVVLTTYGTLTSEFGTEHTHKKKVKIDDPDASDSDDFKVTKKQGPIFKISWYRVILDEAHTIRNKNTRATQACFNLKSYYRWCLTGTLIMNSLDDVYAHLHFLNISPSRSWEHFRDHISKVQKQRPKLAMKRTQAIIRNCCIRRNKESELNGKKLLELPSKETEVVTLEFTDEERQIYTAIENRFQVRFNSFLRKGTVMKHYSVMLVMLMRLRQLTCHPWLLRRNPNSSGANPNDVIVTDEDLFSGIDAPKEDNIAELARASTLMGQDFVDRVKKALEERKARLDAAALAGDEEATREGDCSVCFDAFNDERITPCGHSFCAACVEDIFNAPTANTDLTDEDVQAGRRKCPMCRTVVDKNRTFRAAAFMAGEEEDDASDEAEEADEDELVVKDEKPSVDDDDEYADGDRKGKRRADDQEAARSKKKSRRRGRGQDKDAGDDEDDVAMKDVLPSTKMKRIGQLIDRIHEQDPNQKIIIFSQFVEFIDLCSLFLERRDVRHVKYVGAMNQDQREDTIKQFNRPADEEGSPKVILMSLKCGGVGLNLCIANHVICLDLAWNAATENQAVDRAHRIGQTKEVHVHRLVISNTVEQRIMALQESKQALSDGAMGEGAGGRLGRLSVNDLIRLFGVGGHDEEDQVRLGDARVRLETL